ncbi:MAG: polymer-forming cytoskeletal protein [Anaerolineae bacterium]
MSFFGTRRQAEPAPRPPAEAPPRLDPPQPPADVSQPVGFETVLGANSVMEGSFRSAANVRLDGTFTGTLEIGGNVLIGETAKITADVNARNISIAGAVRGNVTGKKVQLLRTGRVWGDIRAQALTTEEGAFIDGKITMVGHEYSPAPVTVSELEPEPVLHIPEVTDAAEAEPEAEDSEPESAVSVSGDVGVETPTPDSTEVMPAAEPEPESSEPSDEPDRPADA